jgi:hypothetical protein
MSVFGEIILGDDVEAGVVAHLKAWMPTYLGELERQREIRAGKLPEVRSYTVTPQEPEKWAEDQLPAILVVSTGLADTPEQRGDGSLDAVWNVGISSICSAKDEPNTRRVAHIYFHAALAAMLQHRGLSGLATETMLASDWRYDVLPTDRRRTLGAVYALFHVTVDGVLQAFGGTEDPLPDPTSEPDDWPVVETITIDAE